MERQVLAVQVAYQEQVALVGLRVPGMRFLRGPPPVPLLASVARSVNRVRAAWWGDRPDVLAGALGRAAPTPPYHLYQIDDLHVQPGAPDGTHRPGGCKY